MGSHTFPSNRNLRTGIWESINCHYWFPRSRIFISDSSNGLFFSHSEIEGSRWVKEQVSIYRQENGNVRGASSTWPRTEERALSAMADRVLQQQGQENTPEAAEKVQCKITMGWLIRCLCQYLLTNAPTRKRAGGNITTWTLGIACELRTSVRVK